MSVMRVVLSTAGCFHIFPLARELARMGYLERSYSSFTWFQLAQEGVSREKVSTFPLIKPLPMAGRYLPFSVPEAVMDRLHQLSNVALDHYVSCVMPQADIFVGHEAVGLLSGTKAQRRGSAYVCDRGCTHMAWRERVLQDRAAADEFRKAIDVRSDHASALAGLAWVLATSPDAGVRNPQAQESDSLFSHSEMVHFAGGLQAGTIDFSLAKVDRLGSLERG